MSFALYSDHVLPHEQDESSPPVMRDLLMHHYVGRNIFELSTYLALFYAMLVLVCLGYFPVPALVAMVPLASRCQLIYHELCHCRPRIPLVLAVVPFLMGPLSGGFAEGRREHLRHHAHLNTPDDGDWWLTRGGPVRGLLVALFYFEHQFFAAWTVRSERRQLLLGASIRFVAFCAAIAVVKWPLIVWYLIPYRLLFGAQYFLFTYVLHRRRGSSGTFPIRFHPLIEGTVARLQVGSKWMDAVHYHDVHHAHPTVAIQHLHRLASKVRN
jgi:fatty acid desaturase